MNPHKQRFFVAPRTLIRLTLMFCCLFLLYSSLLPGETSASVTTRTDVSEAQIPFIDELALKKQTTSQFTLSHTSILGICLLLAFQTLAILFLIITFRKKQTQKDSLQLSDEQFQYMVESSPIGICIVSDRRFSFVNQKFANMFGYNNPAEITGHPIEELYAPDEHDRMLHYAKNRSVGKPAPDNYEVKGLQKDGTIFDIIAKTTLFQHNGDPSSLSFVIDQTEEKLSQIQRAQADRLEAIGTLAGGIAHDFNNILTAIVGYANLASFKLDDNHEVNTDLDLIKTAGFRAKELIDQILTFSLKQKEQLHPVSLGPIINEVLKMQSASLPQSIDICTHIDTKDRIQGNPTQLHQLLMNLCTNAVYAMKHTGGKLTITLTEVQTSATNFQTETLLSPPSFLQLSVTDTGTGIAKEIKTKIYEPFFTTKSVGVGTGVGLAQVHGIVASHHAHIRMEDNKPQGTIFKIFFPLR